MNSKSYIVMAYMMTNLVVSFPMSLDDLGQHFQLCDQSFVAYVNSLCKAKDSKISGNVIDDREILLSECCSVKCSVNQVINSFCPDHSIDAESVKNFVLSTATVPPKTTVKPSTVLSSEMPIFDISYPGSNNFI